MQLLFVIAAMAATFLLVPRGFSAGEIDIQSDHMSWNTTKGTYQLNLLARIPIKNPNFLNVRPHCLHACRSALACLTYMAEPDLQTFKESVCLQSHAGNMQFHSLAPQRAGCPCFGVHEKP